MFCIFCNIILTLCPFKKQIHTIPCSLWLSSQKTKKICQEVRELLLEEHSAEEKSIPDHRHRIEMPEPPAGRTEDKFTAWRKTTEGNSDLQRFYSGMMSTFSEHKGRGRFWNAGPVPSFFRIG